MIVNLTELRVPFRFTTIESNVYSFDAKFYVPH